MTALIAVWGIVTQGQSKEPASPPFSRLPERRYLRRGRPRVQRPERRRLHGARLEVLEGREIPQDLRPDPKFPNLRAGWYVGSAKDGVVKWFVPDEFGGPEDITADARGDVHTAEWGPQTLRKFILGPARVVLMDKELRQKSLSRE